MLLKYSAIAKERELAWDSYNKKAFDDYFDIDGQLQDAQEKLNAISTKTMTITADKTDVYEKARTGI